MKMRYIDTGSRNPDEALGSWLSSLPLLSASSFRMQTGYFTSDPLVVMRPLLARLSAINGLTTILVGSNDAETAAEDVEGLLAAAGPPRGMLRIGVAYLEGGLFHPKVLHFGFGARQVCYVGSANFTRMGVGGQNIEAGVILDTDESDSPAELTRIAESIDGWFPSRGGLRIVSTSADVESLRSEGVLLDRESRRAQRQEARRQREAQGGTRPRGFRVRPLFALPTSDVTVDEERQEEPSDTSSEAGASTDDRGQWRLVWRSAGLTRRDLNIPTATDTNPTGSMGLKRGDWDDEIDHRHYFREEVFNDLDWQAVGASLRETAEAEVELWIAGVYQASATVTIAHNSDTSSRTYEQRNFMSALRWGSLRGLVADEALLGWILELDRRDSADGRPPKFRIRIDEE